MLDRKHLAGKQDEPQRRGSRDCSRSPNCGSSVRIDGVEYQTVSRRSCDERGELRGRSCPSSSEMRCTLAPCLSGT